MQNTAEREISLMNLFWKLVFGWRSIIVFGVAFAVLLSGLQYARALSSYRALSNQQEAGNEEEKIVLTQEERADVEDVLVLQKRMSAVRNYMKHSIWMNLDAFNENILVQHYYVDSDYTFDFTKENTADYTNNIIAAYCGYATSGEVADAVADKLDQSDQSKWFTELITAVNSCDGESGQSDFKIIIAYTDEKSLESIQSVVSERMEAQTQKISEEIGSHTLKLLDQTITTRVDKDLTAAQKERNDAMNSYRTQLTNMMGNLTDDQKRAVDAGLNKDGQSEEDEEEEEEAVLAEPSFSIKYAILGFLAGAFLACVWLVMEALFSARIQETEEISELYGLRMLGELQDAKQRKRMFGFVDTLLLKWKNCNKKQISQEQRVRIASSNLELACKKAKISRIYVTGSEIEKQDGKLTAEIWKSLSKSGIEVLRGENIVYDANSLKDMAEVGSVIFVEQVGVSLYAEIEKEIKAAKENGIEIIGSLVIGD